MAGETAGSGRLPVSHWLRTSVGIFAAGVGLVASLLSIIFLIWPSFQPDEAPVSLSASLSNAGIEQRVTLGDVYNNRSQSPDANLSAEDLATEGVVVNYDVSIAGYKGEELLVRWSMMESATQARVPEEWLVNQPGWPDPGFISEAAQDSATGQLWTSLPDRSGELFIRLELFSESGLRLSSLDTPAFAAPSNVTDLPARSNEGSLSPTPVSNAEPGIGVPPPVAPSTEP